MTDMFYTLVSNIMLTLYSDLMAQTHKLIKSFKYSTKATKLLHSYAPQKYNSSLVNSWGAYFGMRQFILDVSTRLNSTLDIPYNLVRMQKPLEAMEAQEGSKPDNKHPFLSEHQWVIIHTLLNILQPFRDVTEDLSGQEYPTLGYAFVAFKGLIQNCQAVYEQHSSPSIKSLVLLLKAGLEKHFQKLQKTNERLANMSMVVDPRFRLRYITDITQKATIRQQLIEHLQSLEPPQQSLHLHENDGPPTKRQQLARGSFMKSLDKSSETSSDFKTVEQEVDLWLA